MLWKRVDFAPQASVAWQSRGGRVKHLWSCPPGSGRGIYNNMWALMRNVSPQREQSKVRVSHCKSFSYLVIRKTKRCPTGDPCVIYDAGCVNARLKMVQQNTQVGVGLALSFYAAIRSTQKPTAVWTTLKMRFLASVKSSSRLRLHTHTKFEHDPNKSDLCFPPRRTLQELIIDSEHT